MRPPAEAPGGEPGRANPPAPDLPVSRLGWRSWLGEIVLAVGSRPLRVALTVAGTVLGIATLVAVLGLTTSAQGQISDRFSFLRATAVEIQPLDLQYGMGGFTPDGVARVAGIDGVNAAGVAWSIDTDETMPIFRPDAFASCVMIGSFRSPFGSIAMTPDFVFSPHANAVAAAAESVIREFVE